MVMVMVRVKRAGGGGGTDNVSRIMERQLHVLFRSRSFT